MTHVRIILPILLAATVQADSGDKPPEGGAAGIVGDTARAVAIDPDAAPVPATAISNAEAVFRMRKAVEGFFETRDGYDDFWIRIVRTNGLVGVRWIANIPGDRPKTLQNHPFLLWMDETSGEIVPPPGTEFEPASDGEIARILAEHDPPVAEWLSEHPCTVRHVGGLALVSVPGRNPDEGSPNGRANVARGWPGPEHETRAVVDETSRTFLRWYTGAKAFGHVRNETEATAGLPDGEAFRIALDALKDEPLPVFGTRLLCRRETGRTIVTVVPGGNRGTPSRQFRIDIDDATRAIVAGPEPATSGNGETAGDGDSRETDPVRLACRRLDGLDVKHGRCRADATDGEDGTTVVRILANVSGNGPAADGLETGAELARFSFDPDSRRLEPFPAATNLSDAAAIRIVKEKMPGRFFPGDCPWLLERLSGITVVGVPRRLGWHGTMVFDPIVWIHDGTGAVLAVLCEPD